MAWQNGKILCKVQFNTFTEEDRKTLLISSNEGKVFAVKKKAELQGFS